MTKVTSECPTCHGPLTGENHSLKTDKPYACASMTFLNREDQTEEEYVWNFPLTRVELIDARGDKLRYFEATPDGKWEEVAG